MAVPLKLGMGATLGSGAQPFPWIHLQDAARIYVWAIENDAVSGILNATAPDLVTNKVMFDDARASLDDMAKAAA